LVKFFSPEIYDIKKISDFIAEMNGNEENHIAYCGNNDKEIARSLTDRITDVPFYKCFLIAEENRRIVGILGFDPDLKKKKAEIWGPFINEAYWDISDIFWEKMTRLLPEEIEKICMFVNAKNNRCLDLADKLNFIKKSEETILEIDRDIAGRSSDIDLLELTEDRRDEMKSLHDKIFPGTYYSGEDIISRLNENRKVFICRNNNELTGYIYIEAEPEFGESNIEFFAVKESDRGKGSGSMLLNMALKWLFSFDTIKSIKLCVNSENKKAIKLYEKVGFKIKHQLYYFLKNVE